MEIIRIQKTNINRELILTARIPVFLFNKKLPISHIIIDMLYRKSSDGDYSHKINQVESEFKRYFNIPYYYYYVYNNTFLNSIIIEYNYRKLNSELSNIIYDDSLKLKDIEFSYIEKISIKNDYISSFLPFIRKFKIEKSVKY